MNLNKEGWSNSQAPSCVKEQSSSSTQILIPNIFSEGNSMWNYHWKGDRQDDGEHNDWAKNLYKIPSNVGVLENQKKNQFWINFESLKIEPISPQRSKRPDQDSVNLNRINASGLIMSFDSKKQNESSKLGQSKRNNDLEQFRLLNAKLEKL